MDGDEEITFFEGVLQVISVLALIAVGILVLLQ